MPERSFGRTVRFRRSKLGLSQAKLAELVGRSPSTIRSWERDDSTPNDPEVLKAIAAVLGVEQRMLFEKARVPLPLIEATPTIEQELAALKPSDDEPVEDTDPEPSPISVTFHQLNELERAAEPEPDPGEPEADLAPIPSQAESISQPGWEADSEEMPVFDPGEPPLEPSYEEPRPSYVITRLGQPPSDVGYGEVSYWEDPQERQLYRVRAVGTAVGIVVLLLLLIYAAGKGIEAFTEWWDSFFGHLRL